MKQMTLQRSLFVSIGIHVLLFGTAIAFAGYAGGVLRVHDGPTMVMLVNGQGTPALDATVKRAAPRTETRSVPSDYPIPEERPHDSMASAQQANRGELTSQPVSDNSPAAGTAGPEKEEAGPAAGSDASGQWAVIVTSIEKVKHYPRIARERGIQGVVRVRFKLRPSGEVDRVEIARSSGSDVLDAASVKTVYRASPMPYVNGWLEVPLAYILK
jgi:protein TonB